MNIEDLLPEYKLSKSSYDHSDQDYQVEEHNLLIACSGYYSISELQLKIKLLREAQNLHFGNDY